jgi:hypothetical protein
MLATEFKAARTALQQIPEPALRRRHSLAQRSGPFGAHRSPTTSSAGPPPLENEGRKSESRIIRPSPPAAYAAALRPSRRSPGRSS